MKIAIFGGFLGSGKTSILIQLLKYLAGNNISETRIKVVIIENEIGEVGVDNILLSADGYTIKNLFAGCACCTMTGELTISIKKIQDDINPEWIIVETTGVAYPKRMKDIIQETFEIKPYLCIIVDAKRWNRLLIPMHYLLTGQLEEADTILINKKDIVSSEELEEIKKSVKTYNDTAKLIPVCATMPIDISVWTDMLNI